LKTTAEVGGVAESPEKRDFRDVALCGTRITEFHPAALKTPLANPFRDCGPPARKKAMQMSYGDADCIGDFSWIQRRLRQVSFHELLNPRKQFGRLAYILTPAFWLSNASGQDFQISLKGGSALLQRQHRGFLVKRSGKTEKGYAESGHA